MDLLKILFNEIIPPNQIKSLPGAGDLIDDNQRHFDFCTELKELNDELFAEIGSNDLGIVDEVARYIVNSFHGLKSRNIKAYNSIIFYVFEVYYSNCEVLGNIGEQAVPPFPQGNSVEDSDLTIFEEVYLRGKIYIEQ